MQSISQRFSGHDEFGQTLYDKEGQLQLIPKHPDPIISTGKIYGNEGRKHTPPPLHFHWRFFN